MVFLAQISLKDILQPGDLVAWILVGLIAGSIAGSLVRGRGFGCLGNIVVGLLGSIVGGIIAHFLELGQLHFCGTIVVSIVGAAILIFLWQLLTGSRA